MRQAILFLKRLLAKRLMPSGPNSRVRQGEKVVAVLHSDAKGVRYVG